MAAQLFQCGHQRHGLTGKALQQQHAHAGQIGRSRDGCTAGAAGEECAALGIVKAVRIENLVDIQPQHGRAEFCGEQAHFADPCGHGQSSVRAAGGLLLRHHFGGVEGRIVGNVHDALRRSLAAGPQAQGLHHAVDIQEGIIDALAHHEGEGRIFEIVALLNVVHVIGGIHRREARDEVRHIAHNGVQALFCLVLGAGVAAHRCGHGLLGDDALRNAVDVHRAGEEHGHSARGGAVKHVLADQHIDAEIAVPGKIGLAGDMRQCGQMDHPVGRMRGEGSLHGSGAGQVAADMGVIGMGKGGVCAVDADHAMAFRAQSGGSAAAQHAGSTGQQNGVLHARPRSFRSFSRVSKEAPCCFR